MKKTYSKPDISFESFSLSSTVAAGCGVDTPLHQMDQCGYRIENWIVFQSELQGCNFIVETGVMDGVCYHPPTEMTNLFTS